ncbi:MAG: hypothetical protein RTV41_14545 [Candidatus Thorarchaeota archaeon]
MVRLADIVKFGRKKDKHYFGTGNIPFPKITTDVSIRNQYPNSFREKKLSHLIGTFSSYMIRKMFRDNEVGSDQIVSRETRFTAETVIEHLPAFIDDTKMALMKWAYDIENTGRKWIEKYLQSSWEECIPEAFTLSQLDWTLQSGKLTRYREISQSEVRGLQVYLDNILKWLREDFGESSRVFLKPELSYPELCEARPDIVVDDSVFLIKTVQRPKGEVSKLKERLLGNVALASHHLEAPIDSSPDPLNITSAGIIFPLSLRKYQVDISKFSQKQQQAFIRKMSAIRKPMEDDMTAGHSVLKSKTGITILNVGRISTLRQEFCVNRALFHVRMGRYSEATDSLQNAIRATHGRPPFTKSTLEEAVSVVERWKDFSTMADLYDAVKSLTDRIDFQKQFWERSPEYGFQ